MVTMPAEAATDFKLVRDLVEAGMNVMRVNCAHDGPDAWLRMIRNLRRACRATGRQASVLMDLGGPKLRTGTFPPGPSAVKVSPARDARGKLLAPARVLLVSARPAGLPPDIDAELRVPQALIAALKPGAKLRVTDTRGRARVLSCLEAGRGWRLLAATKSCYFDNGVKLRAPGDKRFKLSGLACAPGEITLAAGELVALTADPRPARVEPRTLEGRERRVAIIPCTLPEVIAQVRVGEPVWFDDGKIGGIVARADATELLIEVTQCREGGARLAGDKGINFPASDLKLSALTAKDREDLRFVARHADMVGLSFVNRPEDVTALRRELVELGAGGMGVVLKIETRRGFANLAPILMAALGGYPFGVMIARGDLAVECGFERLAEIQEELLWICEAAHVPVIWATQVLETLAKKGAPTRAEMTDAAMSGRAECVMLNKGPHIVKALSTLDDVLRRMQGHLSKKQAMLRELSVARLDPPVPA
jgi:pyruvate kinase